MKIGFVGLLFCSVFLSSCEVELDRNENAIACSNNELIQQILEEKNLDIALLSSRINNLKELERIIKIEYSKSEFFNKKRVKLIYCVKGKQLNSVLTEGISQQDILDAKSASIFEKIGFLFKSPFAIAHRKELSEIHLLARRRHDIFGWKDVAFYDLAEYASTALIDKSVYAYQSARDSSEKGYLNTFNHITAQAIITSCYSQELADFVADVHELQNMPELVDGIFTIDQLLDPNTNPIDNYVDMINNEIGQELGKKLKIKYGIKRNTNWTNKFLTDYLNDLQEYYAIAFKIKMRPFQEKDEVIEKFSAKLRKVLNGNISEA